MRRVTGWFDWYTAALMVALLGAAACGGGRPGGRGEEPCTEDGGVCPEGGGGADAGEGGVADDGDAGSPCGNGTLDEGEECDDGNFENGDGCSVTCLVEPDTCGDGTCDMEGGETCLNCVPDCRMHPDCNMCPDEDGDGYRDARCGGDDCSDSNPDIRPGAMEVPCNRRDDDCDPSTPDVVDMDGDGAGCDIDCDDDDASRSPLAREVCGNEIDDDCNPATPDSGDGDGDGYDCADDCNDADPDVNPGAEEICNNFVDDDCDESTPDVFDGDGDGATCDVDCNDGDSDVRPGRRGGEICNDGKDNDCDPSTPDLFDEDRDGATCDVDCDDEDPDRSPMRREICGNEIDDDCDPATPDSGDGDMDGYDCSIDCNDGDSLVYPDASGRCGPGFTQVWTFETGPEGWTSGGSASSWAHGTASGTTISACAEGSRCWVTDLSGDYNNNEDSWIESPPMDLSDILQDPILQFSLTYVTESCCDEAWVEVSTDGGTTWSKVGTQGSGRNWYNDARDWWAGTSDGWVVASHPLTGVAGFSDVRLRIRFSSDLSDVEEGIGIDDVTVSNEIVDLGVGSVEVSGVQCAGDAGTVAVAVANLGAVRVPSYTVGYRLAAGTWVEQTITTPLDPGATATHFFSDRPTFTMGGDIVLSSRVTTVGDVVPSNDQLDTTLPVAPVIAFDGSTTYSADFEMGTEGWTAGGTNASWEHGEPAGTTIDSAASGRNAWVTNLDGSYNRNEESYLYSPCFDMSGATRDPGLQFQHIYQFEPSFDGAWVEVSYDRGLTWVKLGSTTTGGINWYNDATDQRWEGSVSSWALAVHPLLGSAGRSWVRFRFVMKSDGSRQEEGIGIDQVQVVP